MGHRRHILTLFLCLLPLAAWAGPPFITDDADPVDYGHYELIPFYSMDRASDGAEIQGPGADFNYGIWPEVHLNLSAVFTHELPATGGTAYGLGDLRLGAKWRLVDETSDRPELAVYPAVIFPTGDAHEGLGNGQVSYQFPVWIEKNWGDWTSYGGGGWTLNHAPGARDYFFGGWQIQRNLSEGTFVGGEIFAQGSDAAGSAGYTLMNLGGGIRLAEGFSLIFTAGHSFAGASHQVAYMGLYCTW